MRRDRAAASETDVQMSALSAQETTLVIPTSAVVVFGQVSSTIAKGTMTEEVDENGMAKSFSFPVGKSQFVMERLKSEGHL